MAQTYDVRAAQEVVTFKVFPGDYIELPLKLVDKTTIGSSTPSPIDLTGVDAIKIQFRKTKDVTTDEPVGELTLGDGVSITNASEGEILLSTPGFAGYRKLWFDVECTKDGKPSTKMNAVLSMPDYQHTV